MKTYTTVYKIFKAMSLIAMTLVLANCGKSDSGGGSNTTGYVLSNGQCLYNGTTTPLSSCQSVTTAGYGWANGQCYQVGGGAYTLTNTTYCASYPNYQYIGNVCYQITNGVQTQVSSTYCTSTTTTGYGTTCQSQYGTGYNYNNGYTQTCSGLMYGAGGTPVVCAPTMTCGQISYTNYGYQQVTQMNCSGMTLSQSQYGTTGIYCQ